VVSLNVFNILTLRRLFFRNVHCSSEFVETTVFVMLLNTRFIEIML